MQRFEELPVRAAGTALVVATVLLGLAGDSAAQTGVSGVPAALATELQEARDDFSRAYVEGDFDALGRMYTGDAVILPTTGPVRGREAIQAFFTYGPGRIQVAHAMVPTDLRVLGDVVVEAGVWISTVRRGDEPARTASGRHTLVWRRGPDGGWLIGWDMWHQPPPNRPEPELVQAGAVSLPDRHETWPAVDPVDGSLWFSVIEGGFDEQRLVRAPSTGDGWGPAGPAPVAGPGATDRAPRFSPDGSRVYFTSTRPVEGHDAGDLNVWVAERSGGEWGEPRPLPAPVASPAPDMHASAAGDGALWIATAREGGAGRSDVVRFPRREGGYGPAQPLPGHINDALSQPDVLAAPDGSWLIVAVTDHPLGLGGDDLFITRRTSTGWSHLEHIPAPINSPEYEYGPSLSPDGRWLYFTSHRLGSADVFRVPLRALGLDPVEPGTR